MTKSLSDMTLEELWQLFPIQLTPHQRQWETWYQEEAARLGAAFFEFTGLRMHHIGSTAIPTIWAKPIVDILVEVPSCYALAGLMERATAAGYLCMSQGDRRISLNRGYTETGFAQRVFHLHLRYAGDNRELYFRDYLLEHPETAKEYERLKLKLWKQFEHDRDGYTGAKGAFVDQYTAAAQKLYAGRYG